MSELLSAGNGAWAYLKNIFYFNVHVEHKDTTPCIWDCEISCNAQICHLGIVRNDVPSGLLPGAMHKYWIQVNNICSCYFRGHGESVRVEEKMNFRAD